MTDSVEDHLLLMANHLKKIHKYKTSADANHNKQSDGKIEIHTQKNLGRMHKKTELLQLNQNRKTRKNMNIVSTELNMNSEWQHMFGTEITGHVETSDNSSPTPPTESQGCITITDAVANMSLHERSYIQCKYFVN